MNETTATATPATSVEDALVHEIQTLRQGLWRCYAMAGGDPPEHGADDLGSEDLVVLVVDCVHDLRGFFEAARRDHR